MMMLGLLLFFHVLALPVQYSSTFGTRRSLTRLWTKAVETSAVVVTDEDERTIPSSSPPQQHPRPTNLTSPRQWLESEPDGSYTVLRCDRVWGDAFDDWIVWGEEFHIARLDESYQSIFRQGPPPHTKNKVAMPALQQRAKSILRQLLDYATKVWGTESSMMGQVYIVTLLAHHPRAAEDNDKTNDQSPPILQGHISLGPFISHPLIPLVTNIGIQVVVVDVNAKGLPNRLDNPGAKNSAWCRIRRAIEAAVPVPYDEVAMTQGVQLLEGLTSNIFVVDAAGTMQTAPADQVLNGYIRHCLVTQQQIMHPETKIQAPTLDDCSDWRYLFITSSIRLVVPVRCLVETVGSDIVVLWEEQPVVDTDTTASITATLYKSLVLDQYTRAGYGRLCE
jgi:Amino-transferase class IV